MRSIRQRAFYFIMYIFQVINERIFFLYFHSDSDDFYILEKSKYPSNYYYRYGTYFWYSYSNGIDLEIKMIKIKIQTFLQLKYFRFTFIYPNISKFEN